MAGVTVTTAVFVTEPSVAVRVTDVLASTPLVVAVKVPVVAPAGIVIAPVPTDSTLELLAMVTVSPPAGAGEVR